MPAPNRYSCICCHFVLANRNFSYHCGACGGIRESFLSVLLVVFFFILDGCAGWLGRYS